MVDYAGQAQTLDAVVPDGGLFQTPRLSMVIYNPVEERAATSIQVTVGGASPGALLQFEIDGSLAWAASADAEGYLGLTGIPVDESTGAGSHMLVVISSDNGTDSDTFTLRKDPAVFPVDQTDDVDPIAVEGAQGRFVFQDLLPGGLGSWVMPINPASMTNPEYSRTVVDTHTTAVFTGQFHLAETLSTVSQWRLQGWCPNQEYDAKLRSYAALRRRLYVHDHRGRAWTVAITDYTLESRKRKIEDDGTWNDWTGNWSMTLDVLDQDWKTPA